MVMGRPTKDKKCHKLTVRINQLSKEGIEKFCEAETCTQTEAVREIILPIINYEKCPVDLLDQLQLAIDENCQLSDEFQKNREKFKKIQAALDPVMKVREKALDFPKIDINSIEPGTTVKRVILDLRAEQLINRALHFQGRLIEKLYG